MSKTMPRRSSEPLLGLPAKSNKSNKIRSLPVRAKSRPERRMTAYRLEVGAKRKPSIMVPFDSSGKFKDVWSNRECVQCFLKSDVSVTIERNNHGLTAQNTGWNSKLVAELRPLHTHIQVAMVTLVSKQGTFKFAVTGAASRGKNRDRAVNLALGLQILTNHRDLLNIDDEGNLDWMRKQFEFVDEHSEPLPDDSVSDHSSDKDGPATAAAARTVFDRLDSSDESIEDAPGAQGGQATEPKVPKPAAERSDEPKVPNTPRHAPSIQCYKDYYGHDTDTDVVPAKRRREDHPGESAEDSLELEAFEAWDDSEEKNESVRRVKKFINFSNENKLCWNAFSKEFNNGTYNPWEHSVENMQYFLYTNGRGHEHGQKAAWSEGRHGHEHDNGSQGQKAAWS